MITFQWFVMFLPNYSDLLLMKELVQFSRKLQFNNLMVWLWKEGGETLLQKFDRCHFFKNGYIANIFTPDLRILASINM